METLSWLKAYSLTFLLFTACGQNGPDLKRSDINHSPEAPDATSVRSVREDLEQKGYKTFEYVDESSQDTILMQQYFIVFLKRGTTHSATEAERDSLQALHLAHLSRMYTEGHADISGPFGDDGEIRGITIYNTPTLAMADSLAHLDPMVQSGRLQIEVHPWWAAKGYPLR